MLSDEYYKIRSEYVKNSEVSMEETLSSIKRIEISEDEAEPSWCNWSYVIWLEKKLIEQHGESFKIGYKEGYSDCQSNEC